MAEPEFSALTILTEFFSAAHIEASARRPGFEDYGQTLCGLNHCRAVEYGQNLLGAIGRQSRAVVQAGRRVARSDSSTQESPGPGLFARLNPDGLCQAPHW